MKNYNKDLILAKLKRLRVKEINGILIIPANAQIGIKMWGMIDFLKMNWQRKEPKEQRSFWEKKEAKKRKIEIKEIGHCRVCGKEATNVNGLKRFWGDQKAVLHKKICRKKHDWIINKRLFDIKKEVK